MERLGRPSDDVTERQVLSMVLPATHLIFPRYTKPIPESLVRQVKEELFEGDLTEEENRLYVLPYPILVTNS
jgi:hypothetical protein